MQRYIYKSHSLGHRRIGTEISLQKQPKDKYLPIFSFLSPAPTALLREKYSIYSDSNKYC